MPSKTSSFKTLLRSDWRHYWPACFIYTFVWVFVLPITVWSNSCGEKANLRLCLGSEVYQMINATVWMALLFCCLFAVAVFSYLMKSASVQFMHALPVTRRTQFLAHCTAGYSMMTVAHVLIGLLTAGVMAARGAVVMVPLLQWLILAQMCTLFFFALAVLCTVMTGWLLAAPVLYGGLNCVVIAVTYLLHNTAVSADYWGYSVINVPVFAWWLTPCQRLSEALDYEWERVDLGTDHFYDYARLGEHAFSVAGIYCVAGLALAALAYLLYTRRPSETAGDAVSFRWLKPLVRWVIALCGGAAMAQLVCTIFSGGSGLVGLTVYQCVFGAVCFVAVEMLLRKSYRVFQRRTWIGLAALCAVMVAVNLLIKADVFRVQQRLPRADEVEQVTVYGTDFYYTADYTDPAMIRQVIDLHATLIQLPETASQWPQEFYAGTAAEAVSEDTAQMLPEPKLYNDEEYLGRYIRIAYTMTNGTTMERAYNFVAEQDSQLHHRLNALVNDPATRACTLFPEYEQGGEQKVTGCRVNLYNSAYDVGYEQVYNLEPQQAKAVYAALGQARTEEGTVDILTKNEDLRCEMNFSTDEDGKYYFGYTVFNPADCPEVLQLLTEYGIVQPQS